MTEVDFNEEEGEGAESEPSLATKKVSRPAGWFVTFGDLLTLLLCFFLSIVSFGPLGRDSKSESSQNLTKDKSRPETPLETPVLTDIGGTKLAINHLNDESGVEISSPVGTVWLELAEDDFGKETTRPNDLALNKLATLVARVGRPGSILIESCREAESGLERETVERAVNLSQLLKDSRFEGTELRYRLTACEYASSKARLGFGGLFKN